jgi:hypothetical protein
MYNFGSKIKHMLIMFWRKHFSYMHEVAEFRIGRRLWIQSPCCFQDTVHKLVMTTLLNAASSPISKLHCTCFCLRVMLATKWRRGKRPRSWQFQDTLHKLVMTTFIWCSKHHGTCSCLRFMLATNWISGMRPPSWQFPKYTCSMEVGAYSIQSTPYWVTAFWVGLSN